VGLLSWAEKAALENIRFHLQIADSLAREAATTLTLLLAGIGGTVAHVVRGVDSNAISDTTIASLVLAIYLTVLAIVLIFKCMKIEAIPAPTNEPKNLYQPEFELDELKKAELDNMQVRIEQIVYRNENTTGWLNEVRLFAAFSPVVWGAVGFLLPRLVDLAKAAG